MKLLLTIETITKNQSVDIREVQFDQSEISIGRDVSADIRLDGRDVDLKQARLFEQEGFLVLESIGRSVLVNKILVSRLTLKEKDEIQIGESLFVVQKAGGSFEIRQRIDRSRTLDLKDKVARDGLRFDLTERMERWPKLQWAYLLSLVLLIVWVGFPMISKMKSLWSVGSLSSAHRSVGMNCQSCHEANFTKIRDQKCLQCHNLSAHAGVTKLLHEMPFRCVNCHVEHQRDEGLFRKSSRACVVCHEAEAKLSGILGRETTVRAVRSWTEHPEIREREDSYLSRIKFNHRVHMQADLLSADKKKSLICSDCHEREDRRSEIFKKISFKKHCESCHRLSIDEHWPNFELPHGDENLVYEAIVRLSEKISKMPREKKRLRPGQENEAVPPSPREWEDILFTQGACSLCHSSAKISPSDKTKSHFRMERSHLLMDSPSKRSTFNHFKHQAIPCSDCHSKALSSTETKDSLIPKVSDCQKCHSASAGLKTFETTCGYCHIFHEPLELHERFLEESRP